MSCCDYNMTEWCHFHWSTDLFVESLRESSSRTRVQCRAELPRLRYAEVEWCARAQRDRSLCASCTRPQWRGVEPPPSPPPQLSCHKPTWSPHCTFLRPTTRGSKTPPYIVSWLISTLFYSAKFKTCRNTMCKHSEVKECFATTVVNNFLILLLDDTDTYLLTYSLIMALFKKAFVVYGNQLHGYRCF